MRTNLNKILLVSMLLIAAFSPSNGQMTEMLNRLGGGEVINSKFHEVIPFTIISDRICIEARINESDLALPFIIDTYSPCMFNESITRDLALDVLDLSTDLGKQFENTMMKPLFPKTETIQIGKIVFKDIGGMVMSEGEDNPFAAVLQNGLIGANLLKCCIWQFNFENQQIVITDQIEKLDYLQDAITIPFTAESLQKSPNIQVVVNDIDTLDIQFDTGGAGFLSLSAQSLIKLIGSDECVSMEKRSQQAVRTDDKETGTYYFAKLNSLKLGSKVFHDLPVAVYESDDERASTKGNLGIKFMQNFIVTIDWPEQIIYLYPIQDRDLKKNIKTFGFSYEYWNDAMRVGVIYSGSEAEKTGMQIGDEILTINGTSMIDLKKEEIKRFQYGELSFSDEEDELITLTMHIEGKVKTISLNRYKLFSEGE